MDSAAAARRRRCGEQPGLERLGVGDGHAVEQVLPEARELDAHRSSARGPARRRRPTRPGRQRQLRPGRRRARAPGPSPRRISARHQRSARSGSSASANSSEASLDCESAAARPGAGRRTGPSSCGCGTGSHRRRRPRSAGARAGGRPPPPTGSSGARSAVVRPPSGCQRGTAGAGRPPARGESSRGRSTTEPGSLVTRRGRRCRGRPAPEPVEQPRAVLGTEDSQHHTVQHPEGAQPRRLGAVPVDEGGRRAWRRPPGGVVHGLEGSAFRGGPMLGDPLRDGR